MRDKRTYNKDTNYFFDPPIPPCFRRMLESQSRFWWLLAPPVREPSPPPANPEQHDPPSRFWSWGASSATTPKPQQIPPSPKNEVAGSMSYWDLFFSLAQSSHPELKTVYNPDVPDQSAWWPPWPFAKAPDDLEGDVANSETPELFRSARIAIETARDSCHYAVWRKYNTHDVELAVAGTKTQNTPVKYNYRKRPLLVNEVMENMLRRADVEERRDHQDDSPQNTVKDLPKDAAKQQGVNYLDSKHLELTSPDELNGTSDLKDTKDIKDKQDVLDTSYLNTGVFAGYAPQLIRANPKPLVVSVFPALPANLRTITVTTRLRLAGEAFLHGSKTTERHLYMSSERLVAAKKRKKTKNIVVISVHSFLPSKFVKSLVGLSTSSAEVLGRKALAAVARWMNLELCQADITVIALDGMGTIASRVENSLRLLQNWSAAILSADFVYVVANSIGSPLAISLVSHMLRSQHFDGLKGRKIGLLSLDGAICGAYGNTDTKVVIRAYTAAENAIIGEMLDLQRPKSEVSTELVECLSHLCSCNVKITMAGSTSDPLIPLSSSTAANIRHPNIFRCMCVDSSNGIPNFVVQLLSMALTMLNVGYTEHGLVRDLSDKLQGPVGSGGIYSENELYDVGARFALETTSLVYRAPVRWNLATEPDRNLYSLPWNFRGLVHDLVQVKNIGAVEMLRQMVKEYDAWEPLRGWRELRHCFAALEDVTMDELVL